MKEVITYISDIINEYCHSDGGKILDSLLSTSPTLETNNMRELCHNHNTLFHWHIIENFLDINMIYYSLYHGIYRSTTPQWHWEWKI